MQYMHTGAEHTSPPCNQVAWTHRTGHAFLASSITLGQFFCFCFLFAWLVLILGGDGLLLGVFCSQNLTMNLWAVIYFSFIPTSVFLNIIEYDNPLAVTLFFFLSFFGVGGGGRACSCTGYFLHLSLLYGFFWFFFLFGGVGVDIGFVILLSVLILKT